MNMRELNKNMGEQMSTRSDVVLYLVKQMGEDGYLNQLKAVEPHNRAVMQVEIMCMEFKDKEQLEVLEKCLKGLRIARVNSLKVLPKSTGDASKINSDWNFEKMNPEVKLKYLEHFIL